MSEFADLVRSSLSGEYLETFDERVRRQADFLIEEIDSGALDNPDFAVGLELEVYGVDPDGRLATLPESVFEACNKELGRHNAELNSQPSPFDSAGLAEQADRITEGIDDARAAFRDASLELVLDAMWTIPPTAGSEAYLRLIETEGSITIARNMQRSARYCALDNDILARRNRSIDIDLPGYTDSFPTILPESLTTSIQPHLQIPSAESFPRYYNVAIRTMAPILALATNSPFLPADLYSDRAEPRTLLEETAHELRIPVFEQSINAGDHKVRFPRDIESASDIVRRIVEDAVRAPFLREWIEDDERDGFRDSFWEFDHKRGMYWRWLRGIPGGEAVGTGSVRSLRIEYRPLPTQPSVRDTLGLQCLTIGLIRGIVAANHPLTALDWAASRESFYDVVDRGLDAELAWIDRDGTMTSDPDVIYSEIFDLAKRGLAEAGVGTQTADEYLAPLQARWEGRLTPSRWKLKTVRTYLDGGYTLRGAIEEMQRDYIAHTRSDTPFIEWT